MTDLIIVGILAVAVLLGVRSGIKHFKGEGDCCGGGTYKAKPRKIAKVVERKTYKVEGMMCQHCVNRVSEAIHSIEGTSAKVNLRRGTVVVSMTEPIGDEVLIKAVKEAGYDMVKFGK